MPSNDHVGVDKEKLLPLKEIPFQPSTIETIDLAMFDYLDKELNLQAMTNEGFKKVPIIWASTERAYQIKHNKSLRDQEGALILPAIALHRSNITKDMNKRGAFQPHHVPTGDNKGQTFVVARKIKQDKTAEFENAYSNRLWNARARKTSRFLTKKIDRKIVYETISMPIHVWVNVSYSITLKTEYQQQMNELLQPFATKFGNINHFRISRDRHSYESFVNGSFSINNNTESIGLEERKFETKIDIDVLGYLMGEGDNADQPSMVVRENVVEVRFPRERVIMEDPLSNAGAGIFPNNSNVGTDGGYRE